LYEAVLLSDFICGTGLVRLYLSEHLPGNPGKGKGKRGFA